MKLLVCQQGVPGTLMWHLTKSTLMSRKSLCHRTAPYGDTPKTLITGSKRGRQAYLTSSAREPHRRCACSGAAQWAQSIDGECGSEPAVAAASQVPLWRVRFSSDAW